MSDELNKYPIVREQGVDRVVSRKIAAWLLFVSQLEASAILGLFIGLGIVLEDDPLLPAWAIGAGISLAIIWIPFGRRWFFFYYRGILISGKRNRLVAPCFKHDCIWDKFRNGFWPKRHSVPLDEIERLYNSKKRRSRKTSNGKNQSWTIYELNVSGAFGALTMEFRDRATPFL